MAPKGAIPGLGYLHPPKPYHHGTLSVYTIGCKKLSVIYFSSPDHFFFLPKKSQPAWEAEIIQHHHLLPSSAGSSEEQEGDQTGVFKKNYHPAKDECLPCDASELSLEGGGGDLHCCVLQQRTGRGEFLPYLTLAPDCLIWVLSDAQEASKLSAVLWET